MYVSYFNTFQYKIFKEYIKYNYRQDSELWQCIYSHIHCGPCPCMANCVVCAQGNWALVNGCFLNTAWTVRLLNPVSGNRIFTFEKKSKLAVGPFRLAVLTFSPVVKRQGREAEDFLLAPRLRMSGAIHLLSLYNFMAERDNCSFTAPGLVLFIGRL